MALMETPEATLGWRAVDFSLPATDGKTYSLASARGPNGLLVMFICNHCPYVQRILETLVTDAKALQESGVGVIAIMANDTEDYPEDSFENMQALAEREGFPFPYAIDETQSVAKQYGAVCTPDFFGFDADLTLQFRGRLMGPDGTHELVSTMREIAEHGSSARAQYPSMGCSIKWRAA